MRNKTSFVRLSVGKSSTRRWTPWIAVAAGVVCLLTSGCMESLKKHSEALSAATAPVVDQAAAAYQEANAIHEKRMDYDGVLEFEKDHSIAKLRVIHPLMTHEDVAVRLAVLKGFQVYVQTVAELTSGKESKELDDAATSVGANLTSLGNTIAGAAAGGASGATTATPDVAISPTTQNIIATGVNALGKFLVYRAVKKELPKQVIALDPHVQGMCKVMEEEVGIIHDAETKDFDYILDQQKQFLMDPSVTMSEIERRDEIAKLYRLVREQHEAETRLLHLRAAIVTLAKAHKALAEDAAGKNPEPLKARIGELIEAGKGLADFYSSLGAS